METCFFPFLQKVIKTIMSWKMFPKYLLHILQTSRGNMFPNFRIQCFLYTVYSDLVLFMNPFVSHIFCLIFLQIPSVQVCKIPQQTCYSQSVRIYVFTKLEFVYDYSFLWFFCKSTLEGGQKTYEVRNILFFEKNWSFYSWEKASQFF